MNLFPFLDGYSGACITLFQLLVAATAFKGESSKDTRAKYSKFADQDTSETSVSSRIGMLIIYTPAIVTSMIFCLLGKGTETINLAQLCCFAHFVKRDMEVLFIHKYSGIIPLGMAITIGVYYALVSWLICAVATDSPSDTSSLYGTCKWDTWNRKV